MNFLFKKNSRRARFAMQADDAVILLAVENVISTNDQSIDLPALRQACAEKICERRSVSSPPAGCLLMVESVGRLVTSAGREGRKAG